MTQVISKKISKRVEKWKKILKTLIDSKKSLIFILDNELKDLIENMIMRIIIAIELKKKEKEKEKLDDINENNDWDWDYKRNI